MAIIDRNAKAFRRLPTDWPGTAIVGSGFDRDDLDRAKADEAGALAAVTSGDNSNILTARIARETYEIPNVVARIYDPRRAQIYLRLGIPTVATVSWTIDQVRRRLIPTSKGVEWSDPTGTLSLVERPLPDRWAGKRLADLNDPGEVTLVVGDPGRRGPVRHRRPGRPGRRRPPPDGDQRRPARLDAQPEESGAVDHGAEGRDAVIAGIRSGRRSEGCGR